MIGGVGAFFGEVCGGVLLVTLPELLRQYSTYRMLALGLLLPLLIALRRQGLVPRRNTVVLGMRRAVPGKR